MLMDRQHNANNTYTHKHTHADTDEDRYAVRCSERKI